MKVETTETNFSPITITLESMEEAIGLLQLIQDGAILAEASGVHPSDMRMKLATAIQAHMLTLLIEDAAENH